jgi:HTH-type transcriptional regulator/antitoxin HigA
MDIRPIRTEEDYDWALAEIEQYFADVPEQGTPEADRFDVLSELIDAYENRHWPVEPADPVETIRYRMETLGLAQSDLANVIGSRSRASEILHRKRPLTLAMIQRLNKEWGIPADALIAPYHLDMAS